MLLHIVSQGTMLVAHPSRALQSQDRWAMFLFFDHRADRAIWIAMLDLPRPRTKTDRSAKSGWQLAIRFHKYRANGNSDVPSAG